MGMHKNWGEGIFIIILFAICSCGTEGDSELPSVPISIEEPIEQDSTTVSCIALHYQYTDHKKFLGWIEGGDSLRKAFGLKSQTVLRIIEDTTRVLELLKVGDIVRGHEFANSKALKAMADTSGFIGTPSVYLLNAVHMEDKTVGATCMLLQHSVRNFREWRKGFEEYNAKNDDENVRALCIFSMYEDPNEVSVLMEVKNLDVAKALVNSPETVAMMREMGATFEPKMTLLEVWR